MGADYIPEADRAAAAWMRAFARRAASHGSVYQFYPADVETITRVVREFDEALSAATAPSTRNKGTVCLKNQKRASAKSVCRIYAGLVQANMGIADADKLALGLRPRSTMKTRIDCPLASPYVQVMAATNGAHTLTFGDSLDMHRRAKPFGATCLQLFLHVGDEKTYSPDDAKFYRAFTTKPAVVLFQPKDSGKWATYFGRWASRRGDTGMWSPPHSFRIAA